MSDTLKWIQASSGSTPNLAWAPPQAFPSDYQSSAGPALTAFIDSLSRGDLWCVHCGGGTNQDLWYANYTQFNGWANGESKVGYGQKSDAQPALAVYNGQMWCAYHRPDDSLFVTKCGQDLQWDGGNPVLQPGPSKQWVTSPFAPALATFNGAVWCGYLQNNYLMDFVYTQDGQGWGGMFQPGSRSSMTPALAAFSQELWCVFRGVGRDDALYVMTSGDGQTWQPPVPISGQATDCPPALAYVAQSNALVCVYGDSNGYPDLWYTCNLHGDPEQWTEPKRIAGIGRAAGTGIGLANYWDSIFCVYRSV